VCIGYQITRYFGKDMQKNWKHRCPKQPVTYTATGKYERQQLETQEIYKAMVGRKLKKMD